MSKKRNPERFALGYSHPSTIVIVDDHARFLRDMEINVPRDVLYKSFEDPREAMNHINDFGGVEKNMVHRAMSFHSTAGERVLIEVNIGLLEDGIMDPNRFNLPTVLITDLMMPGIDGLELCAGITDRQVKKILLTGKAEENTGIDAFNSGLIDGFVMKSRDDAVDVVFNLATILQEKYFADLQNPWLAGSGMITTFFDDAGAIARIQEIIEDSGYIEHYLTTNPFGYVVVTPEGKIGRIGIFSEEDMKAQVALAKATNAPKSIIEKLENKSHAAMSYAMEPTSYQVDEYPWSEVMCPCEKLIGIQDWWLALDQNGPGPADYDADKASFNSRLYG